MEPIYIGLCTRLTQEEVYKRLTPTELKDIYTLAKSSVDMEIWLDRFKAAEYLDTTDPAFTDGLYMLESIGVLAAGRTRQIIA